jgi:hypothetical protein
LSEEFGLQKISAATAKKKEPNDAAFFGVYSFLLDF